MNNPNHTLLRHRLGNGFSLVEMAIVLAIVALLMAGLLPTISGQVERKHNNDTRKQLEEIRQALIGFTLINGRLPCPADSSIATGQPGAGREAQSGTGRTIACANISGNAAWGVMPWATLGVGETDAWGRRFTYRVTAKFADGADGDGSSCSVEAGVSFQLCSSANLYVYTDATHSSKVADGVPAVVVSHGSNGYGAYTPAGNQLSIPGANHQDEADNADNNNSFVSHDTTPTFDDLVTGIPPNILGERMVAEAKLP